MAELKPCPFCGGEADVFYISCETDSELGKEWMVGCANSFCKLKPIVQSENKRKAIEAWNRRAENAAE